MPIKPAHGLKAIGPTGRFETIHSGVTVLPIRAQSKQRGRCNPAAFAATATAAAAAVAAAELVPICLLDRSSAGAVVGAIKAWRAVTASDRVTLPVTATMGGTGRRRDGAGRSGTEEGGTLWERKVDGCCCQDRHRVCQSQV